MVNRREATANSLTPGTPDANDGYARATQSTFDLLRPLARATNTRENAANHADPAYSSAAFRVERGTTARPKPCHVFRSKVVGVVGCFQAFGVCGVRQVQIVDGLAEAIWSRSARARAAKNPSKSSMVIRSTSASWVETCFLIVSLSALALLASLSR
jgi:hypothetical protein